MSLKSVFKYVSIERESDCRVRAQLRGPPAQLSFTGGETEAILSKAQDGSAPWLAPWSRGLNSQCYGGAKNDLYSLGCFPF